MIRSLEQEGGPSEDSGAGERAVRSGGFEEHMRSAGRNVAASRPVLALLRADGRITRRLDNVLAPAGMSLPKFNILMEVAAAPGHGLPLSEIARRLVKSAPNVTALVDRLERDRLVRRDRSAQDRRVVTATITARGWRVLDVAAPAVFAAEARMLENLTPAECATLADLLDRVAND